MRTARVVLHQPGAERLAQLGRGVPVPQPDDLLLHGSDEALDDGVGESSRLHRMRGLSVPASR